MRALLRTLKLRYAFVSVWWLDSEGGNKWSQKMKDKPLGRVSAEVKTIAIFSVKMRTLRVKVPKLLLLSTSCSEDRRTLNTQ